MFNPKTNTQTTNSTTGSWNVLADWNINAGSVNDGDAMDVHATFGANASVGYADARITLNGKTLWEGDAAIPLLRVRCRVWRSGASAGNVEVVTEENGVGIAAVTPLPDAAVTGLAWGSGQALKIEGKSDIVPGVYLMRAGVAR